MYTVGAASTSMKTSYGTRQSHIKLGIDYTLQIVELQSRMMIGSKDYSTCCLIEVNLYTSPKD